MTNSRLLMPSCKIAESIVNSIKFEISLDLWSSAFLLSKDIIKWDTVTCNQSCIRKILHKIMDSRRKIASFFENDIGNSPMNSCSLVRNRKTIQPNHPWYIPDSLSIRWLSQSILSIKIAGTPRNYYLSISSSYHTILKFLWLYKNRERMAPLSKIPSFHW